MTTVKKAKKPSVRELIFNQAEHAMDELYAKRNALLSETSDSTIAVLQSDLSDLTSQETLTIDESKTALLQIGQSDFTSELDLTTSMIKSNSLVKSISPKDDQNTLTSEVNFTTSMVKSDLLVKETSPENGELKLISQAQLTTKALEVMRKIGFSGIGALSLLASLVSPDGSYIRTRNLARDLNMSYQGLLNQLDRLVEAGYLESSAGSVALGRWIKISPDGQLFFTSQFNLITRISSCSSILNITTTTKEEGDQDNLTTSQESLMVDGRISLTGELLSTSQQNLTTMQPWEKAKLKTQTEELFYVALAAKADIKKLSFQVLQQYKMLIEEKQQNYAIALFLVLLPKARENVPGYISSAIKKGAEPTQESVTKATQLITSLEVLDRVQDLDEIEQKIYSALAQDKSDEIITLAQQKKEVKLALEQFAWKGSLKELKKNKDAFTDFILNSKQNW